MFPSQKEVLNYLLEVAERYGVDRHFKGGIEWVGATWHEKKKLWEIVLMDIKTRQKFTQECQVLISAVGGLVNPQNIDIPGAERFQGTILHTARWMDGLDLSNKRVALIGNGGDF